VPEADSCRIVKSIREMLIFAAQDVKGDPPFLRLDLVSCRNLLIYLEAEAQQQILARIHYALNPGGYLFLGTSETPSRLEGGFEPVSKKWHIYRRSEKNLLTEVLEKQIESAQLDARRRWTRLLREVSHQLGRLESEGERRWRVQSLQARREAVRLLQRLEKAIEPPKATKRRKAPARKPSAAARPPAAPLQRPPVARAPVAAVPRPAPPVAPQPSPVSPTEGTGSSF
jgi:SAM-dependent methyltransferase